MDYNYRERFEVTMTFEKSEMSITPARITDSGTYACADDDGFGHEMEMVLNVVKLVSTTDGRAATQYSRFDAYQKTTQGQFLGILMSTEVVTVKRKESQITSSNAIC